MDAVETEEHEGITINIYYDEYQRGNPREEWDHVGTMLYNHRNYILGDTKVAGDAEAMYHISKEDGVEAQCSNCGKPVYFNDYDWCEDAEDDNEYITECGGHPIVPTLVGVVVLPLYVYEHSGLTMSTSGFSCPWDSGQVGVIYMTHAQFKKAWETEDVDEDKIKECLIAEVKEFDQYLTGDIYGFVVDEDGEHEESCWGFYGMDSVMEEAKSVAEYIARLYDTDRAVAQLPVQLVL
jgi:hypothetical protein